MSIFSITYPPTGLVDVLPPVIYISTNDTLATITTPGYLNNNGTYVNGTMCLVSNTTDTVTWLVLTIGTNGQITLNEQVSPGNVTLPVTSGDFAVFDGTTGKIKDSGSAPTTASQPYVVVSPGSLTSGNLLKSSDVNGTAADSGITPSNVMQINASNTMSAGSKITLAKVNGTEASNAVTANGVAGVITTSSLTTAGGASYAITWTNSAITTTSNIVISLQGGTNTTNNLTIKCTPGSGTATLTIYNTSGVALNGTLLLGYQVW